MVLARSATWLTSWGLARLSTGLAGIRTRDRCGSSRRTCVLPRAPVPAAVPVRVLSRSAGMLGVVAAGCIRHRLVGVSPLPIIAVPWLPLAVPRSFFTVPRLPLAVPRPLFFRVLAPLGTGILLTLAVAGIHLILVDGGKLVRPMPVIRPLFSSFSSVIRTITSPTRSISIDRGQ